MSFACQVQKGTSGHFFCRQNVMIIQDPETLSLTCFLSSEDVTKANPRVQLDPHILILPHRTLDC